MCAHGERAMTAASILTANGWRDVSVLNGGPGDWRRATGIDLQNSG
jgi:hydroxyacylglutathione hydrolase